MIKIVILKFISTSFLIFGFTFLLILQSCSEKATNKLPDDSSQPSNIQVGVTIEDIKEASEQIEIVSSEEGQAAVSKEPEQWLAFEVNIPEAGRYRTEVLAGSDGDSPAIVWVEDYYDNKDGRSYNITGDMLIHTSEAGSFVPSLRIGSPLNTGKHLIKVHFKQKGIKFQKLTFDLLVKHQLTPQVLTQKTEGSDWKLVWSDEFDGEGLPDTSKWTYDIGDWGWGNNELQYYTENRLENARQENGNLIIEAHKNEDGNEWTSARLTTRGKVAFVYGKIELRAKVPPNKGNWAAGWTLGDKYVDELDWPYCGEIDILESVGYEMDNETGDGIAHASVHCGAYYFKLGNQPTSILEVANMKDGYHTYAIDWTQDGIKAFVDDQLYFSYDDTSSELSWPFSDPQNIIINLAMGGGWGGLQGMDETISTQQFILDYVRVYERQ